MKKYLIVFALLCASMSAQEVIVALRHPTGGAPTAAIVQSSGNANFSGASVSVTLSSTGSNAIIVTTLGSSSSFTITDNKSNTYLQVPGAAASVANPEFSDIWYCLTCTSGVTSVTVTTTGATPFVAAGVYEVTNLVALDNGQNLSNGTCVSGSCTGPSITANFPDFLIATGDSDNGFSAVGSPWTFSALAGGDSQNAFIINSSTGAFQPVFTSVGSTVFMVSAAAFKI